jgi:hydrogenase maturation protease
VLGLGNDTLSDAAAGLHVAQTVLERLDLSRIRGIDVVASCETGLSLLDILQGHLDLILVDAVQTGRIAPGAFHEFDEHRLASLPGMSAHFFGVNEMLVLGRTLGLPMPVRVRIFGIEAQDPFSLGTQLTPAVRRAMPAVVERVTNLALHWSLDRAGGRAPSRSATHGHVTEP